MQLIRLGDLRGINLDFLVSWEIEAPPEPEPGPDPGPEMPVGVEETPPPPAEAPVLSTATVQQPQAPAPADTAPAPAASAPAQEPARPPLRMRLTLVSGGAMQTITLDGREAEAMRAYLQGKSGALVR